MVSTSILRFQGHSQFRQRLLLSTLSQKPIRIDDIRTQTQTPGLADYEISFLRLLEKLTNGCTLEISYTGTSLLYRPGILTGGKINHECPISRAIGYYLQPIIALAPFLKNTLHLTITGITNDNVDPSVDVLRTTTLPLLVKFGVPTLGLELKITRRGAPPLGGGLVTFTCPTIQSLTPVSLIDTGKIHKIRGISYATRMAPSVTNRTIETARSLLTRYIPDVYIYSDHYRGPESGKSPGYGCTLVAESTSGMLLSSECAFQTKNLSTPAANGVRVVEDEKGIEVSTVNPWTMLQDSYAFPTPEDLGVRVARTLLREIKMGGCVDTSHQWIVILYSALCSQDVSKVRFGGLSPFTVRFMRDVKTFLGVCFKVVPDLESRSVLLSCLGSGFSNLNRHVS